MANAEGIHSVNGSHVRTGDAPVTEPRTLEDLAALDGEQLMALYATGRPPQLGVLAGEARGRLLAVPAVESVPVLGPVLSRALRTLSSRSWMPWRGKTFAPPAESHRTSGRNRLLSFEALPFDAHVEKSALDHHETLVIKYARPENPWPLTELVDEVREVARGLYLGPAYVRGPNGPVVLLWWAIVKA